MTSRPVEEWFFVTFDDEQVRIRAEPPGREPWSSALTWRSIERVCFKAEDFLVSDGIYVFTSTRPEGYAIPMEAKGGAKLWQEIIHRKLFDAELAIEAASATSGVFCWPPDDPEPEPDGRQEKFENVPMDPDTRILSQSLMTIDGVDALYQKWGWEGTFAESLIFVSKEVRALGDSALKQLARASARVQDGSDFTIKKNPLGYTFVNFNFFCD